MLTATVAIAVMMVNAIKIPFALVIYTAPIPLLPFYFFNATKLFVLIFLMRCLIVNLVNGQK